MYNINVFYLEAMIFHPEESYNSTSGDFKSIYV
jgi:hypothetical protein